MDENPLQGEPGKFKLTETGRSVKEKEAKERERAMMEVARSEVARSEVGDVSQKPSGATSPAVLPSTLGKGVGERKAPGPGKAKSPTSATADGVKKRRKSKAPVTPGVVGPS